MHPDKSRERLDGIQFARFIAASMVLLYHAGRMISLPQYAGYIPEAAQIFAFGNTGLDFFFTLSGFIIFYVHHGDIGQPSRLGHYAWRRVTRIYPMYWLVTGVVILLAIAKGDWASLSPERLITSLLLLPGQEEPLLGVGWTLVHEMFFYCVFAIAILSRRWGLIAALVWGGLIAWGTFFGAFGSGLLAFPQSPIQMEFGFGILSALAVTKFPSARAWVAGVAGVLIFAGICLAINLGQTSEEQVLVRALLGASSALILYGIALSEMQGKIRVPAAAAFLGAASYSIYLVHTIVIGLTARVIFQLDAVQAMPNVAYVVVSGAGLAAGCITYQFVERPVQRWIRGRQQRTAPAAA